MNVEETGSVVAVYCPYCDRAYAADTKRAAENAAKKHVRGQHPEMRNPFEENEL